MKILVIGSGGREHAICWKLAQSPKLEKLYAAPGNPGTRDIAENISLDISDAEALISFIVSNQIKHVIVGPEAPLVDGIHDTIVQDERTKDVNVIGPKSAAAELEGSKDFAKEFMIRHDIPTARYETFTADTIEKGFSFLEKLDAPYVLKADGLAAGKGVLIITDLEEAKYELQNMLVDAKFGDASSRVVIEEYLQGIEFSVFALTDGKDYVLLPEAKDYKRIGEGDTGLNTGGMGAISPVPFMSEALQAKVKEQIVEPTINGFAKDGLDYKGFVFFGLINVEGNPMVIEYNVRMGDPETEVVMPRLKSDFAEIVEACGNGTLKDIQVEFEQQTAVTVMTVSGGYPENYPKGKVIKGLKNVKESTVFHAGTKEVDGEIVTSGGRVMAFTSMGSDNKEALKKSYESIREVEFEGMYFRKDIGFDL